MAELGCAQFGVTIVLTDDTYIRQINSRYRHKDSATNVLSFPFSLDEHVELPDLPILELGDIIISEERAVEEARQMNLSPQRRMTWLVIHGLLHLLGYDHEISAEEERRMFAKEQELLDHLTSKGTQR